jgi:hypothetical protein
LGSSCFAIEKSATLRGCCCTQDTVYVWSSSNVWVHDASPGEGLQLPLQTPLVAAHGNNFYTPSIRGVEAFSRSGVPVATLEIDPNDGRIAVMNVRWPALMQPGLPALFCAHAAQVNGRFLVAATNSNALFLWDVSRCAPLAARAFIRRRDRSSGARRSGFSAIRTGPAAVLAASPASPAAWTESVWPAFDRCALSPLTASRAEGT